MEQAIQREIARLNLVQQVNEAAAAANRQNELALLESLEKKYRTTGNVLQMPAPAPAAYDGPAEQLSLIG